MQMKIYTVYDVKAEAYLKPFFASAKGVAIRQFSEVVNDKKTDFGKYPADYTLFELGVWDDCNASIVTHKAPVSLGVGVEFVTPTQDNPS
jgi:hypothetical protein